MKNWNITQIGFTNDEFQLLCSSYGKILLTAIRLEGEVHVKEIDMIVSLITRTHVHGDASYLKQLGHGKSDKSTEVNKYKLEDNYLKVFELENLILYEIEVSIINFLSSLTDKEAISSLLESHLKIARKALKNIKKVINSKKDLMGKDFIESFYNGLYSYVEKIASIIGKGILGKKVVNAEKQLLDLIKKELDIDGKIVQKHFFINRTPTLLFD